MKSNNFKKLPDSDVEIEDFNCVWPDPTELFDSLPEVEVLEPQLLPTVLRNYLTDVAYRMCCHLDFLVVAALAMIGSIIGTRCGIRPKAYDDWTEYPNLWGAIVAKPGQCKSPALNAALFPLKDLENEANKEHAKELAIYLGEDETFKAKRDDNRNKLRESLTGAEISKAATNNYDWQAPAKPSCKRYRTNDCTVEKLGVLLQENPTGILIFRDEITGLLSNFDKEGRQGERAFLLEAWSGQGSFTFDRIGRGTTYCSNVCVTILGGIQPSKLKGYLNQTMRDGGNDGLLQRFQLLVYPDPINQYVLNDTEPDQEAKDKYLNSVKKVSTIDFVLEGAQQEIGHPACYRFSMPAQEIFYKWLEEHENRTRKEDSPILCEHFSKYRKLMPALALTHHIIRIASEEIQGCPIQEDSVIFAAAMCEYFESHARRVYLTVRSGDLDPAKALLKRIKNKELKDNFSIRDVYRNRWSLLPDKESVLKACQVLCEHDYLRCIETEPAFQQRATTRYIINPKIWSK